MYACALAAGYISLKARSCLPIVEELTQALHNLAVTRRTDGKSIPKDEAVESGVLQSSVSQQHVPVALYEPIWTPKDVHIS